MRAYSSIPISYFPFPILYFPFPILLLTELIKPKINLNMESKSTNKRSHSSGSVNPSSLESNSRVSSSLAEPKAIYRNCKSSLSDRLAEPSAIFTGTEVAALRICEVRPNFSVVGNEAVNAYSFLTSKKLLFQTSRFWCGFMLFVDKPFNFIFNIENHSEKPVNGMNYQFNGNYFAFLFSIPHFPLTISYFPFPILHSPIK